MRRYDDLARTIFRAGDPVNEFEAIKYYWHTAGMRAIRAYLDAVSTLKYGGYAYSRSALLGIVLVAHVLDLPLSEAHSKVQGSDGLRRLFGFPEMSQFARRQQRKLVGSAPIREEGFPVRQTVSYFLNRWLAQSAADVVCLIAAETAKVALEAILDHDLDTTRVAVDGSVVLSPNRSNRGKKRPDPGAQYHKREGEPATFGRLLMSITLTDVPFVLSAKIMASRGESPFVGEQLLPELSAFSERLVGRARERGLVHEGFRGAAVSGDSAFNNTPFIKRLYGRGLLPAFEWRGSPRLKLVGQRQLRRKDGVQIVCDLAINGALYCECDRWTNAATRNEGERLIPRPISERRPMRQFRGRPGVHAYVACENPLCARQGLEFYVALNRGPDIDRGGRLLPGDENYTLVTSLPRTDIRVMGLAFKGRQAIENRHNILRSYGLLGKERGPDRRVIYGDFPHHFWYGLADLVFNQTLAHNLAADRSERAVMSWEELYANRLANGRQIEQRKQLQARRRTRPDWANAPPGDALELAA